MSYVRLLTHLGRGGFGYYWIKSPDGKKTTIWFDGQIPDLPAEGDTYFGVNPARARRGGNERARLDDIAALNCFYAEFDAKHYDQDIEQGKRLAARQIAQVSLTPSVIVDSGGGYHCYWLFDDPRPVTDQKERARLTDIQARWVPFVGGDLDAKDLARVLRVPGTYNYKYDPPREVVFVKADFDQLYYLEDFTAILPKPEPMEQGAASTPARQELPANLDRWLERAMQRGGGRNETGFWLATQLRDDGVSMGEAESVLRSFQARVTNAGNPYTLKEAIDSLKSAYKAPRREPARNLARPAPGNGNGHKAEVAGMKIAQAVEPTPPEEPPMPEEWSAAPPDPATPEPARPAATAKKGEAGQIDDLPEYRFLGLERVRKALKEQESGDADLLADLYGKRIVYDHAEKAWYSWQGHYWKLDATRMTYRMVARRVAPQYLDAASESQQTGGDDTKDLLKRAAELRNKKRLDNVLYLAGGHERLALTGEEWDREPMLLGMANGVVDLRNGEFRPGKPDDFIRARSEVVFDPAAECPTWRKFLLEIFGGDHELVFFLQRLLGYGITGLTTEHVFPILWGEGRNGKSTMLETLGDVLGNDLATSSQADALMDAARGGGDGPKPFVYALRGKRLVWASESNEGRRINEGLVKQLTGGDRLNVRTLHSKPVEFKPTHLLLLITNHKPHINADGSAIWERVLLIPFTQQFVDDPRGELQHKRDPYLKQKLKAELPGIVNWLISGCLEWQEIGLKAPKTVQSATADYREDEDTLAIFEEEKLTCGDKREVKASALYKAYSEFCKEFNFAAMSLTAFSTRMKARYKWKKERDGNYFMGVDLAGKIPF